MFRDNYCAARLHTLDQGAPVSVYTVAKEMGHGGESMVRRVYGASGRCASALTSWSTASSRTPLSWESGWRRCALGILAAPLTPLR
jgi:hypothetical protein